MSCSPRLSATRMAWGFCTFSSVMSTTCVTLARSVEEPARLGEIAGADLDVVAPFGQVDADGFDRVLHVMLLQPLQSRPP